MTRKEMIKRWSAIVRTVFAAETNIIDKWRDRLEAAKNMKDDEADALADEYCEAIAKEIIGKAYPQPLPKGKGEH